MINEDGKKNSGIYGKYGKLNNKILKIKEITR